MHIPYQFKPKNENKEKKIEKTMYSNEDEELENIFIRTYGPIKQHSNNHTS